MRIWASAVVVLASAADACAATGTDGVRISGGSPAEQRVVRVVLGKLRSQRITAVTFRQSLVPEFRGRQEMDVAGVDGTVRTQWDDQLFVAAYLRESLTRRVPEPRLIMTNGDGSVAVHGPRRPGRIPSPGPRASAKVIAGYVSSVKEAAARAKAQVVGVDVMRPGPIGVALTMRARDPASFLKHRVNSVLGVFENQRIGIYARYLGVQGPTRSVFLAIANYPTGGSVYIDPKLHGCNPLGLHGFPGEKFPPCPAK